MRQDQNKSAKKSPSFKRNLNLSEEDWQAHLGLLSKGQKIVIYSIILNFILQSAQRGHVMTDLAVYILSFCIASYSLIGIVKICSGLGRSQNQKILFMVLAFFPFINLIVFVYLSSKTNKILREAGWKIGLLGAKP